MKVASASCEVCVYYPEFRKCGSGYYECEMDSRTSSGISKFAWTF